MQAQPLSPTGSADAFHGWTIASLSVIALSALIVLLGIVYGTRLARARRRAREAAKERIVGGNDLSLASAEPAGQERATAAELPGAIDAVAPASDDPPTSTPVPVSDAESAVSPPSIDATPVPIDGEERDRTPQTPPHPSGSAAPSQKLPLTTIKGLGPKMAAMLSDLGFTRVDQIAALSPTDADVLDSQLGNFAGRMARDRWIDQAKLLAAGDTKAYETEFGKLN